MRGFLFFENERLPDPEAYEVDIQDKQEEITTEAGTRQVIIVRKEICTVNVSFVLKSGWLKKMSAYRGITELHVKLYIPTEDRVVERIMQISDYKATLKTESENTSKTNGIWDVSFTLNEF